MPKTRNWAIELSSGGAAGKDFTVSDVAGSPAVLPDWFELPNGGTLVFVDQDGTSRTFNNLAAGVRYAIPVRSITTCTGTIRLGTAGAGGVPSSGSQGPAGPNFNVTAVKTAAYTALLGDFVLVDPSAGTVAITLPTAVGATGQRIEVKDSGGAAATHTITIGTTSSQTIDGASTSTITTNHGTRTVVSDGANWQLA